MLVAELRIFFEGSQLVAGLELAARVEVEGDVNAVLLEFCEQIIEFVEVRRVQRDRIRRGRVDESVVMVVKAHGVDAVRAQEPHEAVDFGLFEKERRFAEVRAVDAEVFLRRLLEADRAVGGDDRMAVFAGRSLVRSDEREVERTARRDAAPVVEPDPLIVLRRDQRLRQVVRQQDRLSG